MGVEAVSGSRSVLLPSLRTNGGSEGGLFCGNAGAGARGSGGIGLGVVGSVDSRLRGNDEGECGNDEKGEDGLRLRRKDG